MIVFGQGVEVLGTIERKEGGGSDTYMQSTKRRLDYVSNSLAKLSSTQTAFKFRTTLKFRKFITVLLEVIYLT